MRHCNPLSSLFLVIISAAQQRKQEGCDRVVVQQSSSFLTPSIFQKLNEFVCASTPSLQFLLEDDYVRTQVVLQLALLMFWLFPFIHVIRII